MEPTYYLVSIDFGLLQITSAGSSHVDYLYGSTITFNLLKVSNGQSENISIEYKDRHMSDNADVKKLWDVGQKIATELTEKNNDTR